MCSYPYKLQQFFHQVSLAEGNLLQTHVFADKVLEFIG